MFVTGLLVVLVISSLYFLIARPKISFDGEGPFRVWWVGLITLLIALIIGIGSCTAVVQAKNVGVLSTFGKPSDRTLGSGLAIKKPWQKVTSIDATIQTDEYKGDSCITVRLGDGNSACVSTTNRWHVNPAQADDVYANFRSDNPTESLRDAVVSTQFKAAVNQIFGEYNPTADLATVDLSDPKASVRGISFSPDYSDFADRIQTFMEDKLGESPLVDLDGITVSYLKLDGKTQNRINDFIAEVGKTQIALQQQATNAAQAKANNLLSESISNDPNVLVSRCLDLISDGAFDPPAGFSCWPGGGSGVVIPSAK